MVQEEFVNETIMPEWPDRSLGMCAKMDWDCELLTLYHPTTSHLLH